MFFERRILIHVGMQIVKIDVSRISYCIFVNHSNHVNSSFLLLAPFVIFYVQFLEFLTKTCSLVIVF